MSVMCTLNKNPEFSCSFLKLFSSVSDEHNKLHVAMGTGLRDIVKFFMEALALTTLIPHRGWSSEELRWR